MVCSHWLLICIGFIHVYEIPNFDKHLHTMELIVVEVTKDGHMSQIPPQNKLVTKEKGRNVERWGTTYSATCGHGLGGGDLLGGGGMHGAKVVAWHGQ